MGGVIRMGGFGPERAPGPGPQAGRAHEPGNAVAGAGKLAIPKFGSHPWTAICAGVAMGVDDFDLTEENGVGLSPWPGDLLAGGVIPRRGHLESCAEFGNGIGGPHRVNQRIPSCGSSLTMLMAFFKMSRWRRRYSFSLWRRRICLGGKMGKAIS